MDKDAVIAILRAHRDELEKLGVKHAGVFGSVARGEAGPQSDIDIAIDLDEERLPGVYMYVSIVRRIEGMFDAACDVIWTTVKKERPLLLAAVEAELSGS